MRPRGGTRGSVSRPQRPSGGLRTVPQHCLRQNTSRNRNGLGDDGTAATAPTHTGGHSLAGAWHYSNGTLVTAHLVSLALQHVLGATATKDQPP
jgi:hypothetical protein